MNDDINNYLPSILNPRYVKKQSGAGDFPLTQNSVISRTGSLSLKRTNKSLSQPFADLRNRNLSPILRKKNQSKDKENFQIPHRFTSEPLNNSKPVLPTRIIENSLKHIPLNFNCNSGITGLDYLDNPKSSSLSFTEFEPSFNSDKKLSLSASNKNKEIKDLVEHNPDAVSLNFDATAAIEQTESLISLSSATELNSTINSDKTVLYVVERDIVNVSLGINNCDNINLSTRNSCIKNITVSTKNNDIAVECEVIEGSQSCQSVDENMNQTNSPSPPKKPRTVSVNLEIKKKKENDTSQAENSKVLILNTNAIDKVSHVIVQPPNCKLVKKQTFYNNKNRNSNKRDSLGAVVKIGKCDLKQKRLDCFFAKGNRDAVTVSNVRSVVASGTCVDLNNVANEMSKHYCSADIKCEGKPSQHTRKDKVARSARLPKKDNEPHRVIKSSTPDIARAKDGTFLQSPRKQIESIQFNLTTKTKPLQPTTRSIPHHKIIAGTHFAVDAFSYGDIPNVKNYFLTHFHSDHYIGLKKSFNKLLICSKITADLCILRLGVNPKCIHVINVDDTLKVEGIEVTAVDANHCPGAIMLVFTLPNGKTLLHTGDFRATSTMESYPVFWNKDLHTIYLDTTYCNPRYDFPTQDQSLEMALHVLRQKKLDIEKAGKKFASVLIVCGTYTIGKEKFFLGIAGRVGCSVWACPEKDRVLQCVEGRSFSHAPPQACQLHVVPMRDLTYEKLRSYLDSLQGAFEEVVAFKPSGWETGKNTAVEKDLVTIHGIPYSEHSSFSEMIRFVKFLKPKQVVPTVNISGGIKAVQKFFPCPLVHKEEASQSRVTDFYSIQQKQQISAVT